MQRNNQELMRAMEIAVKNEMRSCLRSFLHCGNNWRFVQAKSQNIEASVQRIGQPQTLLEVCGQLWDRYCALQRAEPGLNQVGKFDRLIADGWLDRVAGHALTSMEAADHAA